MRAPEEIIRQCFTNGHISRKEYESIADRLRHFSPHTSDSSQNLTHTDSAIHASHVWCLVAMLALSIGFGLTLWLSHV